MLSMFLRKSDPRGGATMALLGRAMVCGQTVPDTSVVCIDSLWEHNTM